MKSLLPLLALLGALLLLPGAPYAYAEDDVGTLLDLSFENAPMAEVIGAIARASGKNIIISPDVTGSVTLKFHKTPWRQALDALASAHGLTVHDEGYGILRITKTSAKRKAKPQLAPLPGERSRRDVALTNEIAASKARIAQLEREIARVKAQKGQPTLVVKPSRRGLEWKEDLVSSSARLAELKRRVAQAKDAEHAAAVKLAEAAVKLDEAAGPIHLQMYDIRDIHERHVELKGLFAALEREGARVTRNKGMLLVQAPKPLHAKVAKALADARRLAPAARGGAGGKGKANPTIVARVYDAGDLPEGDRHLQKLIRKVTAKRGRVIHDKNRLIVYGTEAVQKFMIAGLDEVRARQRERAPAAVVVQGEILEPGVTRKLEVPEKGSLKRTAPIVRGRLVNSRGETIPHPWLEVDSAASRAKRARARIAAAAKRVHSLERALTYLKQAEAKGEAERVAGQLARAKAEHASMQQAFEQEARRLAQARTRATGPFKVDVARSTSAAHEGLGALHAEVRALRGEVRELTGLVRQLLEQQSRGR